MHNNSAVVIMAKQPQVGNTKTRLCPPLTLEQAAGLYQALLQDTLALAAGLAEADPSVSIAVAFTPPEALSTFLEISSPGTQLLAVQDKDIGGCLLQAFDTLFKSGYAKVLALNSDGPSLPQEYLQQALTSLDQSKIVFGPAADGGYYLVGMRQLHPGLFVEIDWSSERVLAQSQQRAAALGLTTALTPPWYDIDTAADLQRLDADLALLPNASLVHTRRFLIESKLHHRLP